MSSPGTKDLSLPELKKRAEKALALLRGKAPRYPGLYHHRQDAFRRRASDGGIAGLDTPEEL